MKTIYDSNYSNKYVILFDEAYKVLAKLADDSDGEKGLREEDRVEGGKIESLEHYFSYIGDLVDMHTENVVNGAQDNHSYSIYSKFLMLPMDEVFGKNIFSINSDSRTIEVPASFKTNGVSVTGDKLAETLLFEIDRFYDITDLANTEIYVQWMNPAGAQGASKITIVDYETKPGKLVFGWPLTDKITVEGKDPLKFSVRFIKRGDTNRGDEIVYTLNTMPASVKINQALFTQWDDTIEIDDANEMLKEAISNGPRGDGEEPLAPVYVIDLTGGTMQLVNDKARLEVAASSGDNGTLKYDWRHIEKKVVNNQVVTAESSTPVNGAEEYVLTADESFVDKKIYYTLDSEGAYVVYDNDKGWIEGLYEKVSVYEINWTEGDHIAGEYYVIVTNTIGSRTTNKIRSKSVFFECPEKIEFRENLASDVFIEEGMVRLEVEAAAIPTDENISYKWFAVDSEGVEMEEVADSEIYKATSAGWYKVIATTTLNKEVMTAESAICRVLVDPIAPVIKVPPEGDGDYPVFPNKEGIITMNIEIEPYDSKLESDEIIYTWYRNRPDKESVLLTKEDKDVVSIKDGELVVKNTDESLIDLYYCVVTNKLADREAKSTSRVFYVNY